MINVSSHGEIIEINVKGDIDHCEMVELRNAISATIMEGCSKIVLTIQDVGHINYLSIGVLVERLKRIRNCGGDMKLVGMSNYLRNVFTVVGAEDFFDNYDTVEEAMSSFSSWQAAGPVATGGRL